MTDFSIANNIDAEFARRNVDVDEASLSKHSRALASGLRIQSAADDPSGLAIAESLQTRVDAFDRASQNVQTGANAATVADGALAAITDILQRIRILAVGAASSIESGGDRNAVQIEISQLLLEINRISQNTNFNGQALLDGSHAGFVPAQSSSFTVTSNAALADVGKLIAATSLLGSAGLVANGAMSSPALAMNSFFFGIPTGWTKIGPFAAYMYRGDDHFDAVTPNGEQAAQVNSNSTGLEQTVTGLTPGGQYQIQLSAAEAPFSTAVLGIIANGTDVTPVNAAPLTSTFQTFVSRTFTADAAGTATIAIVNTHTPAGFFSQLDFTNVGFVALPVDGTIGIQVINTGVSIAARETFYNTAAQAVYTSSTLYSPESIANAFDNVSVTLGSFTTADVGSTAYIKVLQSTAAITSTNAPAFSIQSGADEGDTLTIGIPSVSTQSLRVSNVTVLAPAGGDPTIAAEDTIGQIDFAIDSVVGIRAKIGATIVRLYEDTNNDEIAGMNLEKAESSIRDADIAAEVSALALERMDAEIGISALSRADALPEQVLKLFRR